MVKFPVMPDPSPDLYARGCSYIAGFLKGVSGPDCRPSPWAACPRYDARRGCGDTVIAPVSVHEPLADARGSAAWPRGAATFGRSCWVSALGTLGVSRPEWIRLTPVTEPRPWSGLVLYAPAGLARLPLSIDRAQRCWARDRCPHGTSHCSNRRVRDPRGALSAGRRLEKGGACPGPRALLHVATLALALNLASTERSAARRDEEPSLRCLWRWVGMTTVNSARPLAAANLPPVVLVGLCLLGLGNPATSHDLTAPAPRGQRRSPASDMSSVDIRSEAATWRQQHGYRSSVSGWRRFGRAPGRSRRCQPSWFRKPP